MAPYCYRRFPHKIGGSGQIRTAKNLTSPLFTLEAGCALTKYLTSKLVGLGRFELPTSPLSGVRSNQLSYRPETGMQSIKLLLSSSSMNQAIRVGAYVAADVVD